MEETQTINNYNLSLDEMIAAGLAFGHQKSKLHPKMKNFVTKPKDKVYLIDLEKTVEKFNKALDFLKQMKAEGKTFLFVGTKVATKGLILDTAKKTNSFFVTERWIGGTFTNFKEIRKRINLFKELEAKLNDPDVNKKYVKKERMKIAKDIERMQIKFGGIKGMEKLPDVIFIADMDKESMAVKEAREVGVKIVAISDTNTNPNLADYAIPANDDAYSSVAYILSKVEEVLA
ncbi:MAG: 30S ribosomal protein S2 [Minisyncoccus archaeiphilus]|jgi:small subunit ribosomal protein S2|uniref:30S ribosomal protein S2 n=1 Tax=Minisyncoccus archaeiphilus TaxID=3238481 RepID=UPI0009C639F7|nr:MAG: 30S ribosomal protein S2 [Parcubacteria group bacterium ADurb.Bin216]GMX59834.1 MAG: 30S ribosomal protein S2 [Candidatus Parcubacteria bacterium]